MEQSFAWPIAYGYRADQIHMIELNADDFIFVKAKIVDRFVTLGFDSGGSSDLILNAPIFDSLNLAKNKDDIQLHTEHSVESSISATVKRLDVFGHLFRDIKVLRTTRWNDEKGFDGWFGPGLLKGFRITIDYHKRLIGLSPESNNDGLADRTVFVFPMVTSPIPGRVFIWLNINGKTLFSNLDTGANRCVIDTSQVKGVISNSENNLGIDSMGLSGLRLHKEVKVDFTSDIKTFLGHKIQFVLGSNVLKDYLVTLDYIMGQVILEPR